MSKKYKSKGYVFDEEVTAWLDGLKAVHGSYNKGLRAQMGGVKGVVGLDVVHLPAGVKKVPGGYESGRVTFQKEKR